jgi:flavodoxin I
MFRYDEEDPQLLILYTGSVHPVPADYREFGERWIARLTSGTRFGIIVVDEPHEHTPEEEATHREQEAEITKLINDFRRDYRDQTSQVNIGYARVMPTEWMTLYFSEPGSWEQAQDHHNRYTQYTWGIPGAGFTDLESAKNWIREQANRDFTPVAPEPTEPVFVNQRVGLFYGSTTGITEYIAQQIEDAWHAAGMEAVEALNIGHVKDIALLVEFDALILGIPTWNIGQLQDDWEILLPQLDKLDFTGKKIAMFGIGDQYGYPDNFLDAVGILGSKFRERGAQLVGYWYDEHYEFSASTAFADGKFMGLGIDEENQSRLTHERIERWVAQIIGEFELQPSIASQ